MTQKLLQRRIIFAEGGITRITVKFGERFFFVCEENVMKYLGHNLIAKNFPFDNLFSKIFLLQTNLLNNSLSYKKLFMTNSNNQMCITEYFHVSFPKFHLEN